MTNASRWIRLGLTLSVTLTTNGFGQQHGSQGASISPDGRKILFTSDRDGAAARYVMNADGSHLTRVITPSGLPTGRVRWADDGSHVLFPLLKGDTVRIVTLEIPDGSVRELGTIVTPGARTADIASDASRLLVGAGDWRTMQLYAGTLGAPSTTRITPGDGAFWCPAFTRDGSRVAVARMDASREMQVWVMKFDGTDAHQVTRFSKVEGSPQCPSWSPDDRRLAVQSAVADPVDSTKQIGSIWVVDVQSGRATKLAEHSAPYLDELPIWFPDGKRIAFQSNRTGRWEIFVMNADGSGARQLTK